MIEMLSHPFMIRALLSAAIIGLLCGYVGTYVVLKRLSFLSEGIGHASILAVAVAFLLNVAPITACFFFAVVFSILLSFISRKTKAAEDTVIGVLFSSCLALGVILMTARPNFQGDLTRFLFGDLLTISSTDLTSSVIIAALVLGLFITLSRIFAIIVFDEQYAVQLGIPTHVMTTLLYTLISVAIVASIRLVGALLVTSLLVVPASISLSSARSFLSLSVRSSMLGVAICMSGVVVSYWFDSPPGATSILLAGVLYGLHVTRSVFKKVSA